MTRNFKFDTRPEIFYSIFYSVPQIIFSYNVAELDQSVIFD